MKKLNLNVDGFIIPNSAGRLNNYFDFMQNRLKTICEVNNLDPEKEYFVQVWTTGKDNLKTENLSCHGGTAYVNEEKIRIPAGTINEVIPASIFNGKKEGDTASIRFVLNKEKINSDFEYEYLEDDLDITLNITLNQQEYRYRSFGTFEEVLKEVCAACR